VHINQTSSHGSFESPLGILMSFFEVVGVIWGDICVAGCYLKLHSFWSLKRTIEDYFCLQFGKMIIHCGTGHRLWC
jgi:hypothetical protein